MLIELGLLLLLLLLVVLDLQLLWMHNKALLWLVVDIHNYARVRDRSHIGCC